MTKRRRSRRVLPHRGRQKSYRKKVNHLFKNVTILVLTALFLAFLVSIAQRHWRGGTLLIHEDNALSPPELIVEYYEESPLTSIEVEVLNGCGEKGIAHKFTDFLRSRHIDVINTGNADRFDYEKTVIIQRNQFLENAYRIAELLHIPKSDTSRIRIEPDLSLSLDVTLILGKDHKKIKPFLDYLKTQP